ncbi:MAG TPA: hypothetical protein VFO14_04505 [Vicinamibacterales bacterium]|nr:hypothetical protein [Vicinamibacterales bacterium]
MTVTLNELLMLAGRLDDSSGFDTPRERFRRFLAEHVTGAHVVRPLIEQCQHAPGDQHHRALHDLVVMLGRCLGFDPRFESHFPAAGSDKTDGHWHSRRLDVVLDIRTDQSGAADLDALTRSVSAITAASQPARPGRTLGLCILTPLYTNRGWLEPITAADDPESLVRVATLGSLLAVADLIAARRLTSDDVVRVLTSGLEFDFVVRLLERAAGIGGEDAPSPSTPLFDMQAATSFWLATVGADQGATPEQFVEVVVGRRRIFGITEAGTSSGTPQAGDGICFYLPGKGVVGHGQVLASLEDDGGIRDAHRFSQLLHLDDVVLHLNAPVPLDEEMQLRVRATRTGRTAHYVTPMSRQEFERLAAIRESGDRRRGGGAERASAEDPESEEFPVSAGESRSPE